MLEVHKVSVTCADATMLLQELSQEYASEVAEAKREHL